jgi:hypothetical protein
MRSKTKRQLDNIVDTFSGGVEYAKFRSFIEQIDRQSENGDRDSTAILEIMSDFDRLIEVSKMTRAKS